MRDSGDSIAVSASQGSRFGLLPLIDLFSGIIKRLQAANFMLHFVNPAF
jgi:hypothetical protein